MKKSFQPKRLAHAISALSAISLSTLTLPSFAGGVAGEIEEITVTGHSHTHGVDLNGEAASVGTVLAVQIEHRPILRPAEVLETVPGMVVTQHSGGGKANQYFLRGFNLDHSTDFAHFVEGAPVNMVTHGHGQGYSDLNFLIPELMDKMVYKKGPYSAENGDFSSAGTADISYVNQLDSHKVILSFGEDGYQRALIKGGVNNDNGHWVYAASKLKNDGPWTTPDDLNRDNLFLKYTQGDSEAGFSASAMYFKSDWAGTDQIPERLVNDGTLGRFDSLDDSTGGDTQRYQIAFKHWQPVGENGRIRSNAYLIDYEMNLFSNFSYFANDPVNGDQFVQMDDRRIVGGATRYTVDLDETHELELGANLRYDDILDVGVGKSSKRVTLSMDDRASVTELTYGGFASVTSSWNDWFTTIAGLRYDYATVDVDHKLDDANSGDKDDSLVSPKLSLRFNPLESTAFFVNYGKGFHSNDARGVVKDDVPLLAETEGFELGLTNISIDKLQLSLVAFKLNMSSELVFVGDEGTTEAKEASVRTGFELSAFYHPAEWLVIDADYTTSDAKFREGEFDGKQIPDSVEDVFSAGVSLESAKGYYGGLRLRYFGPRNLTEDGSQKSDSTSIVNANIGFQTSRGFSVALEVINLLDQEDNDITYFYESRPKSEPAIEYDKHSHPMVPRTARISVGYEF